MSNRSPNRVRRGELILIEEEAFSHRITIACFRVLRTFEPFERLKAFTKLYPDMAKPLNAEGFAAWLEFRQPVKLVTQTRATIFSLGGLPYEGSPSKPEFRRVNFLPNLTINPKESNQNAHQEAPSHPFDD